MSTWKLLASGYGLQVSGIDFLTVKYSERFNTIGNVMYREGVISKPTVLIIVFD